MIKEFVVKITDEVVPNGIARFEDEYAPEQELIRCKDCKHGELLFADYVSCQISDENESGCHASHKPEWFCADGERREFVKPPTGSATDWDGVECE